jgi:hypothetical protein
VEGSGGSGAGEGSSRRGFLRALMRDAARGATEASKVIGPPGLRPLLQAALPSEAPPQREVIDIDDPPPIGADLQPAQAATREVDVEELLRWAVELGLGPRSHALRELAVPSLRLTPGIADEGVWLGGEPELPDDVDWPHWGGGLLDLIVQIDLARTELPLEGHLLLFFDTLRAPSGQAPGAEDAARAVIVPTADARGPRAGEPMRITRELMLPRAGSGSVQALDLDPQEAGAYGRLRARLAQEQGVELEDGEGKEIAYHRMLGLPNDVSDRMPIVCEMTSRDRQGSEFDPLADMDVEPAAARWRLLAQVSGTAAGRLYFWIPREDLEAGDLSTIRVVPDPG